jgi:predicted  nucleic acid-binding Zn-ribbon protein
MAEAVEMAQKVVAERGSGAAPSDALVGKVIDVMTEARGEAGLNIAANRESSPTILEGLRNANIGYTKEDGKKKKDTSREDRAKTEQELYDEFSKKNFDDLTQTQKNKLVDDASRAIKSLPGMASHFAGLPTGTDIDAAARQMAEIRLRNDPEFKKAIIDLHLDRNDLAKVLEDKVTGAVHEEAKLDKQKTTLEKRKGELEKEIKRRETRLKAHEISGKGGLPGATQQEILDMQGDMVKLNSEITTLKSEVSVHETKLEECNLELKMAQSGSLPRGTPTPRPIVDIQSEIAQIKKDIVTKNGQIDIDNGKIEKHNKKIEAYEKEPTKLEEGLDELRKEQKQVIDELDKVEVDYKKQQAEVTKLKALKGLAEEAWVQSLEGITREATITYINKELKDGLAKIKTIKEEEAAKEKDVEKKKLLEPTYYLNPDGKPNKAHIDACERTLMGNSHDVLFKWPDPNNVNGPPKTETLYLNPAQQLLAYRLGYNPAASSPRNEQILKLMKDKTFNDEMSGKVALDSLTFYLWSGGHLSQGEVFRISTSDWGVNMVNEALTKKTELKGIISGVVGKDVLNWSENIGEQLKKIDWKKFALILLIIAGIIGGVSLLKR